MAPKRKQAKQATGEPAAPEPKTEEPKAKVPKVEEKREEKEEEPKAEPAEAKEALAEEPKEKEGDDSKDTRGRIKEAAGFHASDTTLNVVPAAEGRVLMSLTDGGMQFLIAGARGSVGVTAGRYFYEVRVVEALALAEGRNAGRARVPTPRQLVRVGFSLAGSSLVLGDGSEAGVCFDAEGFFSAGRSREKAFSQFGRNQAIGVLLNLDKKSPNADTISLFLEGQRVSQPMPLPEKLKGQTLFPHVSFRNVSLHVNFGPHPMAALPFKCRMLQEAASADVREAKAPKPKDGKFEALFPVAFPDEGTFDWLDGFLEAHPEYVELSDRKILEWAVKSGVWRPKSSASRASNDKPEYNFGLQYMDDFSIRRCLNCVASMVPRNYVVMEVKQNLTEADRKASLKRFRAAHFKRVAHVVMGEPPEEYRAGVHKTLLDEKRAKAEGQWRARKLERERKRAIAQKQKEAAEKAAMEAKKSREEAEKEKGAAAEGEKKEGDDKEAGQAKGAAEKGETKEEEANNEAKEEEEAKEETKDETKEEEDADEPMPQVELTEEEKKLNFRPPSMNDLSDSVLNSTFHQFCIPDKSEGFDEIRYEWQKETASKAYLKRWVLEKKVTTRIEDLAPSESFQAKLAEFKKTIQEWQAKQKDLKDAKKASREEKPADGEEKQEEEEEDENANVDIFSVENVCDVGNGEPLFINFSFEDWALLTLRFELHLLQAAFREDVKDPERIGVHESHLVFYYNRYFRKQLSPSLYGKESPQDVVELVKETVRIDPESKVLASVLEEDPEGLGAFVKIQEQSRRKREQRIDAGDESARLDFAILRQQGSSSHAAAGGGGKAGSWRSRGGSKGGVAALAPAAAVPVGPTGAPRLVPAPRAQAWQGQPSRPWQGGKATYAPRQHGAKGGKKG